MDTTHIFEWAGSIIGLLGAFLLALNSRRFSRYGWVAFLVANFAMIAFAFRINADGLQLQQVGFVITSCIGLYQTGFFRYGNYFRGAANNSVTLSADEWYEVRRVVEMNIKREQDGLPGLDQYPTFLEPGSLKDRTKNALKIQRLALTKLP